MSRQRGHGRGAVGGEHDVAEEDRAEAGRGRGRGDRRGGHLAGSGCPAGAGAGGRRQRHERHRAAGLGQRDVQAGRDGVGVADHDALHVWPQRGRGGALPFRIDLEQLGDGPDDLDAPRLPQPRDGLAGLVDLGEQHLQGVGPGTQGFDRGARGGVRIPSRAQAGLDGELPGLGGCDLVGHGGEVGLGAGGHLRRGGLRGRGL